MSRRLMYWQAYLHKTSLVAELMLTRILKRAKELTVKGVTYLAANLYSISCNIKLQWIPLMMLL
jgi:HD superfamily phosphohydrolase